MAKLYEIQGNDFAAGVLFSRAISNWEKSLGPEHPIVAVGLEDYAAFLRHTGRAEEAQELEVRAAAIRAKNQ